MRKLLILTALIIFALPCFADDMDFWDEPMKTDTAAKTQQKAVTNQEFEKVMSLLEAKKKKQADKKKPKGNPLSGAKDTQAPNVYTEMGNLTKMYDSYPTVMIPVTLVTVYGAEIPPGYYRILSAKRDGIYFLNFYQGNSLIAKIRALDTGNDHNQKSLNYAKVIPVNDKKMNVVYGDIDCNLETTLEIKY